MWPFSVIIPIKEKKCKIHNWQIKEKDLHVRGLRMFALTPKSEKSLNALSGKRVDNMEALMEIWGFLIWRQFDTSCESFRGGGLF